MAASLRNFFITFILALLVFGGLAYSYYSDLEALLPTPENESSVSEEEPDQSDTSSPLPIEVPDDGGDGLGAINGLIVTKNAKGEVLAAKFLRINSENRRIITCDLSLNASLYNRVGALVPLSDYLRLYPIGQATETIRALTGHAADFYLVVTPDAIEPMVNNLGGVSLPLRQPIRYPNPIYDGVVFEEDELLPQDYYLEIEAGTDIFSGDTLSMILGPYSEAYNLQQNATAAAPAVTVEGPSPDTILEDVYSHLLRQLSGSYKEVLKADTDRLARALSGAETNLTPTYLSNHAELLFKYGEANYRIVSIPYSRDSTLSKIKQADQ